MKKKFIADAMLKGLMSWLRFLGFDTIEFRCSTKPNMTQEAYAERYFLTVSPGHFHEWQGPPKIFIPFEKIDEQLNYLNEKLNIFGQIKFLSRCSICNEEFVSINKEDVVDQIPENIAKNFNKFCKCPNCKRIYWLGGHVKRMINKLNRMGVPINLE